MDDRKLHALLHETGPDLHATSGASPGTRRLAFWLAGPLLATALGLGACVGTGRHPARSTSTSTPESHDSDAVGNPRLPSTPRDTDMGPPPGDRDTPPVPVSDPRPPMDTPVPPMDPPAPLVD